MGVFFGSWLRAERLARGLTEESLGGGDYAPSYIALLESGRREPTAEIIDALARRLGIAPGAAGAAEDGSPDQHGAQVLAALHARQAWDMHDYAEAADYAAAAARLALEGKDHSAWWTMTFLQAECLFKEGLNAECRPILERLLEHSAAPPSDDLAVRARRMLAMVCHRLGELSDAVRHAREAVRLAATLPGGASIHVDALRALIGALADAGRVDEAWECCGALGVLVEEAAMSHLSGEVEWVIGNVAFMRGDYEQGIEHHERAAKLLSPANDMAMWARFNKATASVRLSGGIVEPETLVAIERTELAFSIAGGSRAELLEVAFLRARWLYLSGHASEAAERLEEIYAEKDLLSHDAAGDVALCWGRALNALGREEQALELLHEAAEHFSTAGAPEKVEQTADALLEIRLARGSGGAS
ncbi:helix-turn-helix transcriptional regulator [Sinomonas sp. JGH33]|uniref:Helix-turn-helix transcriptional regulator n=1 Tax=Sinomonas terricola TaxID=3110330 RepID=A0ABU5T5Y7_9MICC|nr:helix-turn-helix transcriptional regulator [Sinomonas sp. JGH33]MEA5454947.1 helix-turn-helix transcriptional regulator [Sinomonas sp. JGH33]